MSKSSKTKNWLIGALVVAIIILIFTRPTAPPRDDAREKVYQDSMQVWKAAAGREQASKDSIFKSSQARQRKDSAQMKQMERDRVKAIARAKEAEAAIPAQARDEFPEIQAALDAKDEVIRVTLMELDTAKIKYEKVVADFAIYRHNDESQIKIDLMMHAECAKRNEELTQRATVAEKKVPFLKRALLALGTVVVVETVVLIAKD